MSWKRGSSYSDHASVNKLVIKLAKMQLDRQLLSSSGFDEYLCGEPINIRDGRHNRVIHAAPVDRSRSFPLPGAPNC